MTIAGCRDIIPFGKRFAVALYERCLTGFNMTSTRFWAQFRSRFHCIAALILCIGLMCCGCGSKPAYRDDPCDVVKAYLAAVEGQDNEAIWAFLSDETRKKLDDKAAQFNASPDSGRTRTGADMIRAGHVLSSTREYKKMVLASQNNDSADVDIVLHDDRNLRIQLKKENGRWAVELPI